jgi:hypothetical protein
MTSFAVLSSGAEWGQGLAGVRRLLVRLGASQVASKLAAGRFPGSVLRVVRRHLACARVCAAAGLTKQALFHLRLAHRKLATCSDRPL